MGTEATERTLHRVVLASLNPLVRLGLRSIVEGEFGAACVAEADDAESVLALIGAGAGVVVVVDAHLDESSAHSTTEEILKRVPAARTITLTAGRSSGEVRRAFGRGAHAVLCADSAHKNLLDAIHAVFAGQRYLGPLLGAEIVTGQRELTVTPRERRVFILAAQGFTNREIGEHLGISMRAVEGTRERAQRRLGLGNRVDLVRLVHDQGWE